MTTDKTSKKIVVKGNELIQNVRHNLEEKELMAFTYACSLANQIDEAEPNEDLFLSFNVSSYNKFYNLKATGGSEYKHIKEAFRSLMTKDFWLNTDSNEYGSVPIHGVNINKNTHEIEFYLDKAFVPHLVKVKDMNNYTKIDAVEYQAVTGKYAKRIYELLQSHHDKRITAIDKRSDEIKKIFPKIVEVKISVDSLRDHLDITKESSNYEYKYFKQKVIKKSIEQINKKSAYCVQFDEIKEGNKVIILVFSVSKKPVAV